METKESKRDSIASAARELFTQYGYKGVSMDRIALRAGVAKGTLYLYFKDKEELFNALLEDFLGDIRQMLEEVKAQQLPLPREVGEVVYRLLRYRNHQKFLYRIFQEASELKTHAMEKGVKKLDQLVEDYLVDRFANVKGVEEAGMNVELFAFVVMKAYSALAFAWEEEHPPVDERQSAHVIEMMLAHTLE